MNVLEIVLMVAGISLDLFAAIENEGAKLAQIRKKTLFINTCLVTLLQLAFFFGGYAACFKLNSLGVFQNTRGFGEAIAFLVFAFLGVMLFIKGVRKYDVEEKRSEITKMTYVRIIAVTTIYTLIAGCAAGILSANVILLFVMIIICSIAVVILGLYTGYLQGSRFRSILYIIGAVLLWIAGIGILIRIIGMYV
jgi:putative Mn2+ efflux pump MntP